MTPKGDGTSSLNILIGRSLMLVDILNSDDCVTVDIDWIG